VAEALARFLEALARGKSVHNLTPWVTQVAINVGRSESRHSRVRRRRLPELVSSETDADSSEAITENIDLRRAIAGLPKRQAQVVALRYGLDMSIVDIARMLGLSEGGTKASLSKARRNLARALTIDEGAENE
jgi:RNA polymerase sigma factor (sigma-70 family)